MSRPTLRDVAARAGLSVTQVSRALNDHDDVAESTKQLARKVAAELQYVPNLAAKKLQDPDARTGVIGIVLTSDSLRFSDPFFGELLSSMVAAAADAGRQLSLSTHPAGTAETAPYDLAIQRKQVDGFVVLRTTTNDPRIGFLLDADVPFVTFGRPGGLEGFGSVEVSPTCFVPVVEHLRELGHQEVGCVTEPARFAMGASRLAAFLTSAASGGLTVTPENTVEAGFHEGSGREAGLRLLDRDPAARPTAIVAMNDLLALGVLDAAAEQGVAVPTDLTVIGFDDIQAARQVSPSLTTVRQDAVDAGRALIELLVPAIESGHSTHSDHLMETSLIIRASSSVAGDSLTTSPLNRMGPS